MRQRVLAGDTDEQVKQYIVARYGTYVLLKPPFNDETYLLWLGPLMLLLCAAGAATIYYYRNMRIAETAPLSEDENRRLAALIGDTEPKSRERTMLWFLFALLTFAVIAILLTPILKNAKAKAPARADYDMAVYRDQLREIDQEIETRPIGRGTGRCCKGRSSSPDAGCRGSRGKNIRKPAPAE